MRTNHVIELQRMFVDDLAARAGSIDTGELTVPRNRIANLAARHALKISKWLPAVVEVSMSLDSFRQYVSENRIVARRWSAWVVTANLTVSNAFGAGPLAGTSGDPAGPRDSFEDVLIRGSRLLSVCSLDRRTTYTEMELCEAGRLDPEGLFEAIGSSTALMSWQTPLDPLQCWPPSMGECLASRGMVLDEADFQQAIVQQESEEISENRDETFDDHSDALTAAAGVSAFAGA